MKETKITSKIKTNIQSHNGTSPVFGENFPKMSSAAIGVLLQMVNMTELDYCTRNDLYRSNPADTAFKINRAVDELISNGCIVETHDNRLAVNKVMIAQKMKLVHGNLLIRMEE